MAKRLFLPSIWLNVAWAVILNVSIILQFLPLEARKLFYNSYIQPHFDCCIIWGNASSSSLHRLTKLQKRAARLILDKTCTTPSKTMFLELKWMNLPDRIKYFRSIQVYKCVNGLCGDALHDLFIFTKYKHEINTRSTASGNLYIQRNHPKSCSQIGAIAWNNLDSSLHNATSINAFKTAYLQHLLN